MSDEIEVIEGYLDRKKVLSDTEFLEEQLVRAENAFKKATEAKNALSKSTTLKSTADNSDAGIKANAQFNESTKAVIKLVNDRFAAEAKLNTLQADRSQAYLRETAKDRVESEKLTKALKDQAAAELAPIGSRQRAMAQIRVLTAEKDKLNLVSEEEKKQYDGLVTKIERYENFLKRTGSTLEKQRLNIGNYAGSLAKPFETLQNKLDEIRKDLEKGIGLGGGKDAESLKAAAQAAGAIETALDKSGKKGATATAQVKALEGALQSISLTVTQINDPPSANTFLDVFKKQVGEAKDSVQDLKDEIKLNASDTKGIDNIVGSLNGLVGVAQGAAGAYALLGGSEEEANKITAKLIAVQGIANSVQAVGAEITRRGSIAYKALTAVQEIYATATNASATATVRLAAGSKLLFGGAIIAALAFIIVKIVEANNQLNAYQKTQQQTNQVVEQASDSFAQASATVSNLKTNIQLAKDGFIDKNKVVKEYNETIGKTTGEVHSLDEAEQALNKNADAYVKFTLYKAAATIAFQEAGKKAFEAQQKLLNPEELSLPDAAVNRAKTNPLGFVQSFFSPAVAPTDKEIEGYIDLSKKQNKKQVDALNEEQNSFEKIGKDFQEKAAKISKDFKFNFFPDQKEEKAAKPQKIKDNTAKEILQEQYEQGRLLLQENVDTNKGIFDNEKNNFDKRLQALKDFNDGQRQLVELQKEYEIAQEGIRLKETIAGLEEQKKEKGANIRAINEQEVKERAVSKEKLETIETKATIAIGKIQKDGAIENQNLVTKYFEERRGMFDKEIEEYKKREALKRQITKDLGDTEVNNNELALRNQFEIDSVGKTADQKRRLEEKLQADITELRKKAALTQLVLDEKELERKRALLILVGQSTAAVDKQISDNALEQSKLRIDITKNEEAEKTKLREESLNKAMEFENAAVDLITTIVNNKNTKEKNAIQDQIDAVEKKKQKDIEAENASADAADVKAAKIAIIEANAQAKREQLEARQRMLDYKRAKFERDIGILQIVIQIALAVAKQQYFAAALAGIALAKAIATPLPKFFRGKDKNNKYEGPAMVNDAPRSNYMEPIWRAATGKIEFPVERNHITHLAADDIVFSSMEEMLTKMAMPKIGGVMPAAAPGNDNTEVLQVMKRQTSILNKIAAKPDMIPQTTERGMTLIWKHASRSVSYTHENTNWHP